MRIKCIALNCRFTHSCPALFYVRNELKKVSGATIVLEHYTINDPYYETLLKITEDEPDFLFFSVYIWNADFIFRLAQDAAAILPEARIVFGGPQITYMDRTSIPDHVTLVRGEVEGLPESFYTDLQQGFLQKEYKASFGRAFSFPYEDEDFTTHLKNRNIYYESSRGCPFSCSYCLSSIEHGVWTKDVEEVKKELAKILTHRPKMIRFIDRTFNLEPSRTIEIWRFLIAHEGETAFHFEIGPDRFTEEMFSFLKTVPNGRFRFEIGLQSTNPETLRAVNRRMKMDTVPATISRLADLDTIHLHLDLILGLPHETERTFKKSFNDVYALAPHYIQMGLLKVLPGTALAKNQETLGITCRSKPAYEIMSTRWMDHRTIRKLYWLGECVEAFYNNRFFSSFFQYIRSSDAPYAVFNRLLSLCRRHSFFERARTQELMSMILVEFAGEREDSPLLLDLLRYDWLRCGHRFLPSHLQAESLHEIRGRMRLTLPQNYPPLYDYRTREEFFKRSVFIRLSDQALKTIGFSEGGVICLLPERTKSVHRHQETVLLPHE